MNKYRAKKTQIDNITFDSQGEAKRYAELRLLERAGAIRDLQCQPRFELQAGFKRNGRAVRALKYTADFQYQDGPHVVVEEFKGKETVDFRMRERLFLARFPEYLFRVTCDEGVKREWIPERKETA